MPYPRSMERKSQFERDARIARLLMRRLRQFGLDVDWWDKRELGGFRLHPANLWVCGRVWILCRAASYGTPNETDALFLAQNRNALLWRASDDFDTLARYLWLSTGHNPFDMPKL